VAGVLRYAAADIEQATVDLPRRVALRLHAVVGSRLRRSKKKEKN
jgi:hypothetical protein